MYSLVYLHTVGTKIIFQSLQLITQCVAKNLPLQKINNHELECCYSNGINSNFEDYNSSITIVL